MEKSPHRITFKIIWENTEVVTLFLKNNKLIKIVLGLIELQNKECLMIEEEKLLEKKLEITYNKQITTIISMKNKLENLTQTGGKPIKI